MDTSGLTLITKLHLSSTIGLKHKKCLMTSIKQQFFNIIKESVNYDRYYGDDPMLDILHLKLRNKLSHTQKNLEH